MIPLLKKDRRFGKEYHIAELEERYSSANTILEILEAI
jgi:hypothetical protein